MKRKATLNKIFTNREVRSSISQARAPFEPHSRVCAPFIVYGSNHPFTGPKSPTSVVTYYLHKAIQIWLQIWLKGTWLQGAFKHGFRVRVSGCVLTFMLLHRMAFTGPRLNGCHLRGKPSKSDTDRKARSCPCKGGIPERWRQRGPKFQVLRCHVSSKAAHEPWFPFTHAPFRCGEWRAMPYFYIHTNRLSFRFKKQYSTPKAVTYHEPTVMCPRTGGALTAWLQTPHSLPRDVSS